MCESVHHQCFLRSVTSRPSTSLLAIQVLEVVPVAVLQEAVPVELAVVVLAAESAEVAADLATELPSAKPIGDRSNARRCRMSPRGSFAATSHRTKL